MLLNVLFVFTKQIFYWHLHFLFWNGINHCFVITNEEFEKKCYNSGIKLIIQTQICKIWLIPILFFFVFRVLDTWLTPRTCDGQVTEQILQKIWLDIQFCQWDFQICPCPEDMSRTFPTKVFRLKYAMKIGDDLNGNAFSC